MRGKLRDLTLNRDGSQNITVTVTDTDYRPAFDDLAGVEVEVEIKRHRKRRSLDANAYAWALINRIAAATGQPPKQIYREAIRDVGGVSDIVCAQDRALDALRTGWEAHGIGWVTDTMPSKIDGCTNVILYYGSSTYDTAQMTRLIDIIIQEAKAIGIETDTPETIARLQEEWQRLYEKKQRKEE